METLSTVRRILGKDLKETGVASVFTLVVPFLPWNAKRIEANKRELVRVLADTSPWRGLRFGEDNSWFVERLSRALPVETAASRSPGWLLFEPGQVEQLSDALDLGSWALYFSRKALTPPSLPLSDDPAQALRQTKDTGADLGIIAGPDDREWLICIAPDS